MQIIDITGVIESNMWHLGNPLSKVNFEEIGSIKKEGWVSHNLILSAISGTYLETGAHMIEGYRTIDEIVPKELFKKAVIIKVKKKKPKEQIELKEIKGITIKKGDAVLLNTGWSSYWKKKEFVSESPYFTEECIDYLLSKKISLLGSDMTSFDKFEASYMIFLKKLFDSNVLILSPLINLDKIKKQRVDLIVFPLKLKGVSASPCRAMVIER
ncbi:MAG: cyclase family protein [bacterium]